MHWNIPKLYETGIKLSVDSKHIVCYISWANMTLLSSQFRFPGASPRCAEVRKSVPGHSHTPHSPSRRLPLASATCSSLLFALSLFAATFSTTVSSSAILVCHPPQSSPCNATNNRVIGVVQHFPPPFSHQLDED